MASIAIILVCAVGYFVSYYKKKQGNYTYALFLLLISGLALRIYCATDPYLHSWDERYHALVAKHLLNHCFTPTLYEHPILPFNYSNWGGNSIWLHKQPLTLWLIALSLKLFGCTPFAVRIPSILLSTIGIYLVYKIAEYLYNKSVAFYTAFLFSIHGLIIELSAGRTATDHVDLIFMFFVLCGIFCSVQYAKTGKYINVLLTGLSLGLAILTKWLPAVIILIPFTLLTYKKHTTAKTISNLLAILIVATIIFLPWQLYIFHQFPIEAAWEYHFNQKHFVEVLEHHGGNYFYHFDILRIIYGEFIYIPVIYHTYITIKEKRQSDIIISLWFWIPMLFYTLAATKMPAYTLIAAPAIFMITVRAFIDWKEIKINKQWQKRTVTVLAYGFILLPIRYSIERLKPFEENPNPAWNKQITAFAKSALNTDSTIIFNCPHPAEMMFATKCTCYEITPDSLFIHKLKQEKYIPIILGEP